MPEPAPDGKSIMIIVAGQAEFDTRYLAEVQADIREIEAATRREDGCLYYAMAFDDLEQGHVTVLERWRDEAALNAHLRTPALKAFQERNLTRARSFSIKLYEVVAERDLVVPD
jgi:quinol monooxygenase YgiN